MLSIRLDWLRPLRKIDHSVLSSGLFDDQKLLFLEGLIVGVLVKERQVKMASKFYN